MTIYTTLKQPISQLVKKSNKSTPSVHQRRLYSCVWCVCVFRSHECDLIQKGVKVMCLRLVFCNLFVKKKKKCVYVWVNAYASHSPGLTAALRCVCGGDCGNLLSIG